MKVDVFIESLGSSFWKKDENVFVQRMVTLLEENTDLFLSSFGRPVGTERMCVHADQPKGQIQPVIKSFLVSFEPSPLYLVCDFGAGTLQITCLLRQKAFC